ncbi:hypothetical protein N9059_01505 [bacterium]|nr:hypothetical protein [bacterium]
MSDGSNPTEEQKNWLAKVLGQDTWEALENRSDFRDALNVSLGKARQLALQYMAKKQAH